MIYAKAERPRLTRRPKASIWLVHHHLRSLNTVNKGHSMKNMSIERIILDVLNSLYLGRSKYTKALRKQTSDLFIRRLLKADF